MGLGNLFPNLLYHSILIIVSLQKQLVFFLSQLLIKTGSLQASLAQLVNHGEHSNYLRLGWVRLGRGRIWTGLEAGFHGKYDSLEIK